MVQFPAFTSRTRITALPSLTKWLHRLPFLTPSSCAPLIIHGSPRVDEQTREEMLFNALSLTEPEEDREALSPRSTSFTPPPSYIPKRPASLASTTSTSSSSSTGTRTKIFFIGIPGQDEDEDDKIYDWCKAKL